MKSVTHALLGLFASLLIGHGVPASAADGANSLLAAEATVDDGLLITDLDLSGDTPPSFAEALGAVDISGLPLGVHAIHIRLQDQAGTWSAPISQSFYLPEGNNGGVGAGGGNTLTGAEAFIDDDPGQGAATAIASSLDGGFDDTLEQVLQALSVEELSAGPHAVYLRFRDANGNWSLPLGQSFHVPEGGNHGGAGAGSAFGIQAAEAFIDVDPGEGAAQPLPIAADGGIGDPLEVLSGTVTVTGLTPGIHTVYVRFRDHAGFWSAPLAQSLFLSPSQAVSSGTGAGVAPIIAAEVSVDGGAYQPAPAADGSFGGLSEQVNLSAPVSVGIYHSARVRFIDSLGRASADRILTEFTPNDQDWNGLPDAWELERFGITGIDPDADPDGDLLTNRQELLRGTDPLVADDLDVLTISGFVADDQGRGLAGITLCIEAGAAPDCGTQTDALGHYVLGELGELSAGSYRVYPMTAAPPAAYGFNPTGRPVTLDTQSIAAISFTAEPLAVSLTAPAGGATYQPGDRVTLQWIGNGAATASMVLAMKRDSVPTDRTAPAPGDPDWFRFTLATANDGSEVVTIPAALSEADDWRFYLRYADTDVYGPAAGTFSYRIPVVLPPPTVTIETSEPEAPVAGELLTVYGSAGPPDQTLVEYHWSAVHLVEGIESGERVKLGSDLALQTDTLPAGDWRFYFQARNDRDQWSSPATLDLTLMARDGLADLALGREDVRLVDGDGNRVVNPQFDDLVTIEVDLHNAGDAPLPDDAVLRIYDGQAEDANLLVEGAVVTIDAGGQARLELPWVVGRNAAGNPIPGFDNSYQILLLSAELRANIDAVEPVFLEANRQNNQTTALLAIGTPANDLFGLDLSAGASRTVYPGELAAVFGSANYRWGSQWPVMGARITVTIDGGDYDGRTTSPSGRYSIAVRAPDAPGVYPVTVSVFDNYLFEQTSTTLTVVPRPVVIIEPGDPRSTDSVLDLEVDAVNLSGDGLYHTDDCVSAVVTGSELALSATLRNVGTEPFSGDLLVQFYSGNPWLPMGEPIGDPVAVTVDLAAGPLGLGGSMLVNAPLPVTPELPADAATSVSSASYYATLSLAPGEIYFFNNLAGKSISVRANRPDLMPPPLSGCNRHGGLRFDDTRRMEGESVTVVADVINRGPGDLAGGFDVDFYEDGTYLDSVSHAGALASGAGTTVSLTLTGLTAGDHDYLAIIDPEDAIDEDGEYNNEARGNLYVYPAAPDLHIALAASDRYPAPGAPVTLTASIGNRGGLDAAATAVSFYLDDPDNGGGLFGRLEVPPVAGKGGGETVSLAWTAPTVAGSYRLYARLEANGRSADTWLEVTANPPLFPDLQLYSEDILVDPILPLEGDEMRISAMIRNVGERDAEHFVVVFSLDTLSGNYTLGAPVTVASLPVDSEIEVTASRTELVDQPFYAIKVEALPNYSQGERNAGDNQATTAVAVDDLVNNLPPTAIRQKVYVLENGSVEIGMLDGIEDPEGRVLTAAIIENPGHGSLDEIEGNEIRYTPESNYVGPDVILFDVSDGIYTIEARIDVVVVNSRGPTLSQGYYFADYEGSVTIDLSSQVKGDPAELKFSLESKQSQQFKPLHGVVELADKAKLESGVYIYRPDSAFSGSDSFAFFVSDGIHEVMGIANLVVYQKDSDGDAIPDSWEDRETSDDGIHLAENPDTASIPPEKLRKEKKDIYLWIDHMYHDPGCDHEAVEKPLAPECSVLDFSLDDEVIYLIQQVFADYDIDLHAKYKGVDHRIPYEKYVPGYPENSTAPERFDCDTFEDNKAGVCGLTTYKNYHFYQVDGVATLSNAREGVYRYVLVGDEYKSKLSDPGGTGSTGFSDDGTGVMFISRGELEDNLIGKIAGTLLHELGHTLGLGHGGPKSLLRDQKVINASGELVSQSEINYKPNYLSTMNYLFQLSGLPKITSAGDVLYGGLDYSRFRLSDIDEGSLVPHSALDMIDTCNGPLCDGAFDDYASIYFSESFEGCFHGWLGQFKNRCVVTITDLLDVPWEHICSDGDESCSGDINWNTGFGDTEEGETKLVGAVDWDYLDFSATGVVGLSQGIPVFEYVQTRMSTGINDNPPKEAIEFQMNYDFGLTPTVPNAHLYPGESRAIYSFRVLNTGTEADDYDIVYDSAAEWGASGPTALSLEPGEEVFFQVQVTAPVNAQPDDEDRLTIEVTSVANPLIQGSVTVITQIDPIPLVDADLDGFPDDAEPARGMDPANPDTDGDGLIDGVDPEPLLQNPVAVKPIDAFPGDFDLDGDVDYNDLLLLRDYLNTPATGPDDPYDMNADGNINILDFRAVVPLCTLPRCAIQ